MENIKNKVVIVTGASSGLGKELSIKLAQEGAIVALVARSKEELEKVKFRIIKEGGRAEYFVCDIRDLQQVKATVSKIMNSFGRIDILVNNAGIWTDNDIEAIKPEQRQLAFETNAVGNIQFTYEILPYFQKENRGYVFNVISTSGVSDSPSADNSFWITYGATKWALAGFTKDLRTALKDTKIKITGFFPGGFESNLYERVGRENSHNQPWMMKAEDVADVILFALSRPDDVLMEKVVVTKVL